MDEKGRGWSVLSYEGGEGTREEEGRLRQDRGH